MSKFDEMAALIRPQVTDIWGLKYFPNIEPSISNDQDHPVYDNRPAPTAEVSDCNMEVVRNVVQEMGSNLRSILEIGIARNGPRSMSTILMGEKPNECIYVGVDLEDKSYLDNVNKRIFTMRSNSARQEDVRNFLRGKGIEKLDLLFIDGWHSVNMTINDWRYSDILNSTGIVICHDTNSHPGCVALYEAVDEHLFDKVRLCTGDDDYGISVFRRKV